MLYVGRKYIDQSLKGVSLLLLSVFFFSCEGPESDEKSFINFNSVPKTEVSEEPEFKTSELKEENNQIISSNNGVLNLTFKSQIDSVSSSQSEIFLVLDEVRLKHNEYGWLVYDVNSLELTLSELQAGITKDLAAASVPIGEYSEVRFKIVKSYLVNDQGEKLAVEIPSGAASGVKLKASFFVGECDFTRVIMNWDLSGAITEKGNHLQFQPQVSLENNTFIELECVETDCTKSAFVQQDKIQKIIKSSLGKEQNDELSIEDYNEVRNLNISSLNLNDIDGIECLRNLSHLNLSYNNVSDVSALAYLPSLTVLYAKKNQISDITSLSLNKQLIDLRLNQNNINDLGGIETLTNLEVIHLPQNNISSLPIIGTNSPLRELNLSGNQLEDLDGISFYKNLVALQLSHNLIGDFSSLSALSELRFIYASNNQEENIEFINNLGHLRVLIMRNNKVKNFDLKNELHSLKYIDLSYNEVQFINGFEYTPNLEFLYLDNNEISDTLSLKKLLNLKEVSLRNNPFSCPDSAVDLQKSRGVKVESDCF